MVRTPQKQTGRVRAVIAAERVCGGSGDGVVICFCFCGLCLCCFVALMLFFASLLPPPRIFPHEEVPNALYWAGNEPSIFAVWLFNWADRADLAQNYSRALLSRRYTPTREVGLPGNDDFGTISAWATFAAMGLYPQAGNTTYALGSPVFPALTIQRAAQYGGPINIVATGASDANVYVQAASLGSQALSSPFIDHGQLGEATLTFTMGSTPNRQAFKKRQ